MKTYLAFHGHCLVSAGELLDVALTIRELEGRADGRPILVFDESTGRQLDIDISGSRNDLIRRFSDHDGNPEVAIEPTAPRKRGRPKLGVVGREVTLLPRHWSWLDSQRGGASPTLRRLVDRARTENEHLDRVRRSQDDTNRFLSAIAGDLPGFEEATRALYARDRRRFVAETKRWPKDIKTTALKLAHDALTET